MPFVIVMLGKLRKNTIAVSGILGLHLRILFIYLFSECKVQDVCIGREVHVGPCPVQLITEINIPAYFVSYPVARTQSVATELNIPQSTI